jgi:hypothetical protein
MVTCMVATSLALRLGSTASLFDGSSAAVRGLEAATRAACRASCRLVTLVILVHPMPESGWSSADVRDQWQEVTAADVHRCQLVPGGPAAADHQAGGSAVMIMEELEIISRAINIHQHMHQHPIIDRHNIHQHMQHS